MMDLPEGDGHAPDGLGLEAVAASDTSPVTQASGVLDALHCRGDKGVGILCVNLSGGLANDIAVEERHGLSKGDCADDEGDKKERVDTSHYEKAKVGFRPVVTHADHDVEGSDASLGVSELCCSCASKIRTTLRVPTNSLGGSTPVVTII